jgi:hypothetical protein
VDEQHEGMIERWRAMLVEIRAASGTDYAMYAVANRELLDLALSGQRWCLPLRSPSWNRRPDQALNEKAPHRKMRGFFI